MASQADSATVSKRVGFLLVPGFSQFAFIAAIEPLRMANELADRTLYTWHTISRNGNAVTTSSQLRTPVDFAMCTAPESDLVLVCSGVDVQQHLDRDVLAWLRRLENRHVALGAVCTGAYILARAGVLDDYRCALHWEEMAGLHGAPPFPRVQFGPELFVIDRDRYTCSGGLAAMDMMLTVIARAHGPDLAERIAEEYMHERIRDFTECQHTPLKDHLDMSSPKLAEAITLMRANVHEPLTLDELASLARVSRRQLERLFQRHLGCVPTRYYMSLRLTQARHLLCQTALPVTEVALACGFISPPHFTKCYHEYFGCSPSEERRLRRERLVFGGTAPASHTTYHAPPPRAGNIVRERTDTLQRRG